MSGKSCCIGEMNAIQHFELVAEILLKRSLVTNVRAGGVFEFAQLGDQVLFNLRFCGCHRISGKTVYLRTQH